MANKKVSKTKSEGKIVAKSKKVKASASKAVIANKSKKANVSASKVVRKNKSENVNAAINKIADKSASNKTIKNVNKNVIWMILVALLVVAAVILAVLSFNKTKLQTVESMTEIKDALNIDLKDPIDANDIVYSIENDDIARMDYSKDCGENGIMYFVMRSSAEPDEDIVKLNNKWGTKIIMTVICNDESDIEVEAYVAIDDSKIMKGTWYDNDLYYSMTTDTLTTREDFLQEVNRVIIDNHIEF